MNKIVIIVGIAVILVAVWFGYLMNSGADQVPTPAPAPDTANTNPIKIGFIGPLTGDASNLGQNAKAAIELAVDEVNHAGGINGRQLQVIFEDGQCTGKVASAAANKLINADRVSVILGGACSGETMSFAAAAEQAKTVVLSYCSSAPAVTSAGDFIFRDYPSDTFQGSYAANYIYNTLGKKKVAVMYVKTDWGVGIKTVFKDAFQKLGGQIVDEEGYDQTSRDLRTQLTKVKAANPELLYFLGYTDESIAGLKQAAELGLNMLKFGGDAWDDAKIAQDAGPAAEGTMYVVPYAPLNDQFKAAMKTKTGSDEIMACTPTAYDGIKILAKVMASVGTDATAVKDALYKTDYENGVSSAKIRFDANGDLVGASYVVKKVIGGKATVTK